MKGLFAFITILAVLFFAVPGHTQFIVPGSYPDDTLQAQGLCIQQHDEDFFIATLNTYALDGRPTWYRMTLKKIRFDGYWGAIIEPLRGQSALVPGDHGKNVTGRVLGSANIEVMGDWIHLLLFTDYGMAERWYFSVPVVAEVN